MQYCTSVTDDRCLYYILRVRGPGRCPRPRCFIQTSQYTTFAVEYSWFSGSLYLMLILQKKKVVKKNNCTYVPKTFAQCSPRSRMRSPGLFQRQPSSCWCSVYWSRRSWNTTRIILCKAEGFFIIIKATFFNQQLVHWNRNSPSPFYQWFPEVLQFSDCQAFEFHRTDL